MSRVTPLRPEQITERDADLADELDVVSQMMGFTPEDAMILARRPELFRAVKALVSAAYAPGRLSLSLKKLVGHVASRAAGCTYCTAHTAHAALESGVSRAQLDAVWSFATSPLFAPGERAVLALAQAAAVVPSVVEDAHVDTVREHYGDDGVVEAMGVVALFGFLNRLNAALDTTLEAQPAASFASLKHGGDREASL